MGATYYTIGKKPREKIFENFILKITLLGIKDGQTNGTRLEVTRIIRSIVVVCRVLTEKAVGTIVEFPPYCFVYKDEEDLF